MPHKVGPESDLAVVNEGWISVTPLCGTDRTDYKIMEALGELA